MTVDASVDLDGVAVLPRIDMESFVHLVAIVEDAEIDLLGVAGVDLDSAVVGVYPDLGAAGDRVGFRPIFRLGARGEGRERQHRQHKGECDCQFASQLIGKHVHLGEPPSCHWELPFGTGQCLPSVVPGQDSASGRPLYSRRPCIAEDTSGAGKRFHWTCQRCWRLTLVGASRRGRVLFGRGAGLWAQGGQESVDRKGIDDVGFL